MKRFTILLVSLLLIVSLTAFSLPTKAEETATPGETVTEPTSGPVTNGNLGEEAVITAALADSYPRHSFHILVLPDGTKILQVYETQLTREMRDYTEIPAVVLDLLFGPVADIIDSFDIIYHDVIFPGGKKIHAQTYDLHDNIRQNGSFEEDISEGGLSGLDLEYEIGDHLIRITAYEIGQNYGGDDVISFIYDFTNGGDETTSAGSTIDFTAYQDGIELNWSYTDREDNSYLNVRPGATITDCVTTFELRSLSLIELEISDWYDWDSAPTYVEFDLTPQ